MAESDYQYGERLRSLIEHARDLVLFRYRLRPEPGYEYVSPGVDVLGYTPGDFYANPGLWQELVHPDDAPAFDRLLEALGEPLLVRWRCRDGPYRWVQQRHALITDEHGDVVGFEGLIQDITAVREASDDRAASERWFRALVQNTVDVILVCEPDGRPRYVTPSITRTLGYEPAEVLGTTRPEVIHDHDLPRIVTAFDQARTNHGEPVTLEFQARHKDGTLRWLEAKIADLAEELGVGGFVLNMRDITERKRAEDQLAHLALHDGLTALPNRVLFLDRLAHAVNRLARRDEAVVVLFIDLDQFKVVNDSLGHAAGDEVLVAVAERLRAVVRPDDTAARLGGDEFAVLCEEVAGEWEAIEIVERIAAEIRRPLSMGPRNLAVTASIGIAIGRRGADGESLLSDADAAVYRAKERGRNRFEIFDADMRARAVARLDIEHALRLAVERGELAIHYQPAVSLVDGHVVGAEALLRWHRADGSQVPASRFIEIAEDAGLINAIGEWALREACREAARWGDVVDGPCVPPVWVNLSARQLAEPGLPDLVVQSLADARLDPNRLQLEITESVLMEDAGAALSILEQLKRLGVVMAIDDFGTGYSSFTYLRRFPVEALKLDQSYVAGLGQARQDSAIVKAVTGLAATLGLDVIAEGVEKQAQVDQLLALGCHTAQGNLFSPAVPADQLRAILRARAHTDAEPVRQLAAEEPADRRD